MKFSVLMSLYIKEDPTFLAECFESLKNQTYPADEIVVLFDGKVTEALENVVAKYEQILPIKAVRFAENRGLGKTLNEGLNYCSHEWVFRMDTDDICVPERFEKQVKFIEQNPDVIIFGGQIAEFNRNIQDIVAYRNVPTEREKIVEFTRLRCPFNHMTVAYQKSKVQECGGYQGLQEDYTLWIKMVANGNKVANLPDVLVYARVGNGMVGRRRGWKQFEYEWQLYRLKNQFKIHNPILGLGIFLMRAVPRILPLSVLTIIYKLLRK
ncbi:amylovoran biosynthesis protein AmsE [Haemophilus paracuniculus]|uniref:Amylovoran biosynthesis protein AmsE n=1 Tax=Haemophilus paracuniculus TaxID=734 RepID=A0A1T0AQP4_9PAST|nr:glycosyltransferase [Haemophilus paracuniculus]OOR98192.1 amylovoran biosynthesis protein AmsE [Haemophilus paracuniculus]